MEEMLDTFDIDGNFVGVKSRAFCHSDNPGVYHKPVWIWIKNDKGQILVQKRAVTKKQSPGKWDMPSAGHVTAGESLLDACVRETNEELGVDTTGEDYHFVGQYVVKDRWELGQVYTLSLNTPIEDFVLQREEVEKVEWLDYNEFIKLLYSDKFCAHEKAYKDFVADLLK